MKTNASSKNHIQTVITKDNNINNGKIEKRASDKLISIGTLNSKLSNLNFNKVKTRNSVTTSTTNNDNKSIFNNNLLLTSTNEREKTSMNNNFNNNIQKNKKIDSNNVLKDMKIRKDANGVPIIRGKKRHRVTFKDMIDIKFELIDEVEVESYKDYNAKEISILEESNKKINNDNNNDNTSCTCLIF